ncbi:MAG: carboxysome shell protein [Gammaproteobacteria bacterium]|nr:carboxysome shell protein [Gammaproteobacteria bacterium]
MSSGGKAAIAKQGAKQGSGQGSRQAQGASVPPARRANAAAARVQARPQAKPEPVSPASALPESRPVAETPAAARPAARATVKASAGNSARQASRQRRQALSSQGKQAVPQAKAGQRTRQAEEALARSGRKTELRGPVKDSAQDCGCGCNGSGACQDKPAAVQESNAPARGFAARSAAVAERPRNRNSKRPAQVQSSAKAASLARRRAQSQRGKAGLGSGGLTQAQTARAAHPDLSSRELAKALREQRSKRGNGGQKKSAPSGKRRKAQDQAKVQAGAQDASWKVGASQTSQGQRVTGTQVGRFQSVTGDEPGSCRTVTGTEYLAADIFREFCQTDLPASPQRVSQTSTGRGVGVTGVDVGRSDKVTGNEPGSCKRVTGSEYLSAEQMQSFCGKAPEPSPARGSHSQTRKQQSVTGTNPDRNARVTGAETGANRELTGTQYTNVSEVNASDKPTPAKVGQSSTLRGGRVSGTLLGRREGMTGDEAGSCRQITGDEYLSAEQYNQFCDASPKPEGRKVGRSRTLGGEEVTGSLTGRSLKVTGDEPGTCKSITGTPYIGAEQYNTYCEAPQASAAISRAAPSKRRFGAALTGQQPAVAGAISGDAKGACEAISGTPYVGADQIIAACPSQPAEPQSPDFPQPLMQAMAMTMNPIQGAQRPASPQQIAPAQVQDRVTGTSRAMNGQITGAFDKAGGKVTGTEEARFGRGPGLQKPLETAAEIDGRVKSRISGEGMDSGMRITGDDWDRGDRVTGTEGLSASRRNPSLRGGPAQPMAARAARPQEAPEPVSKVTGSSGNTSNGALITYSGGARG